MLDGGVGVDHALPGPAERDPQLVIGGSRCQVVPSLDVGDASGVRSGRWPLVVEGVAGDHRTRAARGDRFWVQGRTGSGRPGASTRRPRRRRRPRHAQSQGYTKCPEPRADRRCRRAVGTTSTGPRQGRSSTSGYQLTDDQPPHHDGGTHQAEWAVRRGRDPAPGSTAGSYAAPSRIPWPLQVALGAHRKRSPPTTTPGSGPGTPARTPRAERQPRELAPLAAGCPTGRRDRGAATSEPATATATTAIAATPTATRRRTRIRRPVRRAAATSPGEVSTASRRATRRSASACPRGS